MWGGSGRRLVINYAKRLRRYYNADWLVVNAENAAGGAGITGKIAQELLAAGVDGITLGDHVWDQKNFESEIDEIEQLCRPANLPSHNPGRHILF